MNKPFFSTGLRWLWLVVLVIVADGLAKQWVMSNMQLHEIRPLIPSLNLFYARNYGAAFSFLADKDGWQRWFFTGIAIAVVIALLVMLYRNRANQVLINSAYALVIGGAIGNLIDRTWHGFVVDFIDFYLQSWHFATFNLADCAICVGAGLVVLEGFIHPANKPHSAQRGSRQ